MKKRIFIGLINTAGYGTRLVKGFRNGGVKADLYLSGEHPFKYDQSYSVHLKVYRNKWVNRIHKRLFLIKCLFKYDAFIFFSGESILKNFKDFKYYRFFNRKTMMLYFGCDIQQPELTFREDIPYSACHNCTQEYKDFVGCVPDKKIIRTKRAEKEVDFLVSHLAFSDALNREYVKIIQPINLEDYPAEIPENKNKKPVILHAPSNFGYKGTSYLVEAIEKLKEEFDFEFRLVSNVTIKELYREIMKADLVVDQLIQGWYGMLPLEAMMLKKPVVCYIRDDVESWLPAKCPLINANPSTIYSVLKDLLKTPEKWKRIGEEGRKYVQSYHDAEKIARSYLDLLF